MARRGIGGLAVRAFRGSPYGRLYAAGRYGMKYGPQAYKAIKTFSRYAINRKGLSGRYRKGRWKKNAAMFSKSRYGHRVGTSTCKMAQGTNVTAQGANSKTLYVFDKYTNIPQTNDMDITTRKFKAINLRGVKTCFHVENNLGRPVWLNFAILQRKDKNAEVNPHTTDFFRDTGRADQRSTDFGAHLSGLEMKCLPINSDKFLILRHSRVTLGPKNAQDGHKYYKTFDFYKHMNRQIRYSSTSGLSTEQAPLEFVFWCSTSTDDINDGPVVNAVTYSMRNVTYFRDIDK